jgi:hypothetical protein
VAAVTDGTPERLPLYHGKLGRILAVASAVGCYLILAGNALWLLQAPLVGVADNGDFWRVARPAGIEHADVHPLDGRFADATYKVTDSHLLSGGSSASCLAWLAARLGASQGFLDIRWVGTVYLFVIAVLLTTVVWCGLPRPLILLVMIVFMDAAYLPFLNSFYADGALFVALIGTALWFYWLGCSRSGVSYSGLLAIVTLATIGGWTKVQYSFLPLSVLTGLLISGVLAGSRLWNRRCLLTVLLLCGAATCLPTWFLVGPGPDFPEANRYHAIFGGILVVSSHPERTLESLGVPKEYWGLPRRDVFSGRIAVDHPVHEAISRVSRWQVALQYLQDPTAIERSLDRILGALSASASHERGTRQRGVGGGLPGPRMWDASRLRAWAMSAHPRVAWTLFAIWVASTLAHAMTRRALAVACSMWFLVGWSVAGVVLTVLGDGFVSLRQHLVGFRLGLDILAAISVYYVLLLIVRRATELRSAIAAGHDEVVGSGRPPVVPDSRAG